MSTNHAAPPSIGETQARLDSVRQRLQIACRIAGRDPASVTLVAVSKTFEPHHIEPVLAAGERVFGENRVQEAKGKWPALKARFPDVELHLIGPLQTNKVRDAVALFDVVQSLDRASLAEALATEMQRTAKRLRLFVQVNTGKEPQKSGVAPETLGSFISDCRQRLGLLIDGLMCIPPVDATPAPHFALLAELAKAQGLSSRSMGMSSDYEEAIRKGATHVRIGTSIFGVRDRH